MNNKVKTRVSKDGGLILSVAGWHCVCTSCGHQWFTSQKEQPDSCIPCKVRHKFAEDSIKKFRKKADAGEFKIPTMFGED